MMNLTFCIVLLFFLQSLRSENINVKEILDEESILNYEILKYQIFYDSKDDIFNTDRKRIKLNSYKYVENINCNKTTCGIPYGACLTKNVCKCTNYYANKISHSDIHFCSYKRKSQFSAFLLELVFSFGVGHFYLERYNYALLKFTLEILLLINYLVMRIIKIEIKLQISPCVSLFFSLILTLLGFVVFTFHFYDVVMLGMNKYTDGQGISLVSWNILQND